jgi:hypothetical protein
MPRVESAMHGTDGLEDPIRAMAAPSLSRHVKSTVAAVEATPNSDSLKAMQEAIEKARRAGPAAMRYDDIARAEVRAKYGDRLASRLTMGR